MKRRSFIATILTITFSLLGLSLSLAQTDRATLNKRMLARVKAVDTLKASGKVGENNQGTLTVRQKLSKAEAALVKAENTDRLAVYQLIAKEHKRSPKAVGRLRAEGLRKKSTKGVWLQDAKGKWYKKV